MAFWGLEVKPGKAPTPLSIERRLVIKQAALVVKAAKKSEPCVLSVRCSLRARRWGVGNESIPSVRPSRYRRHEG